MIFSFLHPYLLLAISVFGNAALTTVMSFHSKKYGENSSEKYKDSFLIALFTVIFLFVISGFKFYVSAYSVFTGVLFGLVNFVFTVCSLAAYKEGPMSLTVVIVNFSTVFTALSGAVLFKEKFNPFLPMALAFLVASSFFCAKKENENKANLKWLILSVLSMLFCTGIGLMQKLHQESAYKEELVSFLIVSFLCMMIFSASATLFFKLKAGKKKEKAKLSVSEKKDSALNTVLLKYAVYGLIAGLFNAINHVFNLYLSGIIPAATFFPLVNGIPLVLSIASGFIFLKEKLDKNQIIGLILGTFGIAFIIIVNSL